MKAAISVQLMSSRQEHFQNLLNTKNYWKNMDTKECNKVLLIPERAQFILIIPKIRYGNKCFDEIVNFVQLAVKQWDCFHKDKPGRHCKVI